MAVIHNWWAKLYYGTPAEKHLEPFVASLGVPYRLQFPYFLYGVRYFPDVLWPTLGVILEVDDESHLDPEKQKADALRTSTLESLGWRVLRCTNEEAFEDPQAVMATVLDFVAKNGARNLSHIPRPKKKAKSNGKRTDNGCHRNHHPGTKRRVAGAALRCAKDENATGRRSAGGRRQGEGRPD